jgi:protein phosphatase
MVLCPSCRHDSSDPLFCDRCNGALPSPRASALPAEVTLSGGRVVDCSAWAGAWPADCRRPLSVCSAGRAYRAYALNPECWGAMEGVVRRRAAVELDVLAPLEVHPLEGGAVVVAEGLPGASRPLLAPPPGDEMARLERALAACEVLAAVMAPLHQAGLVWLNFDPEALEADGSSARLVNLDLQVFPSGACPDILPLSAAYSPPEVCGFRADRIGPATDVFHASLYLYYRLAGLLPGGFPGRGLEAFDFDIPPLRIYRPHLPVGVAPVLGRGLDRDPAMRYPSVDDLLDAFAGALSRVKRRQASTAPVSWESAGATAVGRSHELQGLPNQDAHAVVPLPPEGVLAVVADGVTHARVGSGEVASQTAVAVLTCLLPFALHEAQPEATARALTRTCLEASRNILGLALAVAPPGPLDPADLMSSTVVVGVAAGNALTLASVGDSRAYLISEGRAEQLTVDGDVRCTQLAAGWAPEEILDMGTEASALYTCLGVGEPGAGGALELCVHRGRPSVSHWPILPGDAVVLCSDGLVEEGVFLEPAELVPLVADPPEQSPAQTARRLVEAARSRHRDASSWEPAGCGDDVTCVVLVARPARCDDSVRSEGQAGT